MKEVTEWNGKPRWMWCWDFDENLKGKVYVICILTEEEMLETGRDYPVRALDSAFKHCAEIEEETKKETRLTNYELSQLLKCLGVEEGKFKDYSEWHCEYGYNNGTEKNECPSDIIIRYRQGEWEEPTRETVWKWWGEETPDSDIARFVSFIGWDKE